MKSFINVSAILLICMFLIGFNSYLQSMSPRPPCKTIYKLENPGNMTNTYVDFMDPDRINIQTYS